MIGFRFFMVCLLFSALQVGCTEPFIAIDIKTGGGTLDTYRPDDPDPGCFPGLTACAAHKKKIEATVTDINESLKLYMVTKGEISQRILVPPDTVAKDIGIGDTVTVEILDNGTYKVLK